MKIVKTAPDALKILWKDKVFLKSKNVKEIEEDLEKRGYNFTSKNLMMALKSAKYLTRKGRKGSFGYVQKHPYVQEEGDEYGK